MATMNISLPDDLRDFVNRKVATHSYSSTSEYLRELIRRERDIEMLREKLLAGRDSGPAAPIDDAWLARLRASASGEIAE
ncbi:type II toxin-antitoxin system ParD family antitoxin [Thiorhodococcus minor]|uniref:Antitoxin ParD n=1 Tax=Thiorhodococcus minor TaxID=57489 RepID=A0A6M0JYA5_9GAMM|nr:type II toxin-antitoxin system ParD family antitoxin [Thiorhodococcus minor]NEV62480.1 type II toxin-antitoxin system ParD family antitoxin [Thiorhodococcus minor]